MVKDVHPQDKYPERLSHETVRLRSSDQARVITHFTTEHVNGVNVHTLNRKMQQRASYEIAAELPDSFEMIAVVSSDLDPNTRFVCESMFPQKLYTLVCDNELKRWGVTTVTELGAIPRERQLTANGGLTMTWVSKQTFSAQRSAGHEGHPTFDKPTEKVADEIEGLEIAIGAYEQGQARGLRLGKQALR